MSRLDPLVGRRAVVLEGTQNPLGGRLVVCTGLEDRGDVKLRDPDRVRQVHGREYRAELVV